jgi:hypothetical protein
MTTNTYGNSGSYLNGSSYTPQHENGRDTTYEIVRELAADEPMDRIRELLFGDLRRSWEARLQTLETRLQMLEDKLEAVRHDAQADRQEHIAALAQGIDELGLHVRRLTRG